LGSADGQRHRGTLARALQGHGIREWLPYRQPGILQGAIAAKGRTPNFATERGRTGYDKYRHDFAKLIWQIASLKWDFDDATFDRSASSFSGLE
jgi:hypothetical protein